MGIASPGEHTELDPRGRSYNNNPEWLLLWNIETPGRWSGLDAVKNAFIGTSTFNQD